MNAEMRSGWMDNVNFDDVALTIWGFFIHALPSVLIFGFIFLTLSVILLWFCRKRGIFKRKTKFWNIVVRLNYLYVPSVFVVCGMACGMLSYTKSSFEKRHKEIVDPLSQFAVDSVVSYITDQEVIQKLEGRKIQVHDLMIDIFGDLNYTPKADSFVERQKAYLINQLLVRGGRLVLSIAVRKVLSDLCTKAHVGATIEDNVVEFGVGVVEKITFPDTSVSAASVITAAVHAKIQRLLSSLYFYFATYLVLFLIPPAAEIGLYFILVKKRHERSGAMSSGKEN